MIKLLKRYLAFIICLLMLIVIFIIDYDIGLKSFQSAESSFLEMLKVLPPIMILLGLIDVWVPRESLMKYMGDKSGVIGVILSMLIGSIAAGPMYAAFPFTVIFLKKGVKFSNVMIFMNAWCVTKLSTLLFEFSSLGYKFTLVRLLIDIPGVIIMGYIINYFMDKESLNILYKLEKTTKID